MARPLREHPNAKRVASPAVRAKMLATLGKKLQRADAEEVMQRAYVRLLTLVDRLPEDDDGLLGLVVVVVRGQMVDHFRRDAVHQARHADGDEADAAPEVPDRTSLQQQEEYRRLYEFAKNEEVAGRVDPDCLRWAERLARGDTYADIARDEGIPEATIRKRMERFRKHMASRWRLYSGLAGVVVCVIFFVVRPKPEPPIARTHDVDTAPSAASSAPATEWPAQHAERLRREARAACDLDDWDVCGAKLDEARDLDVDSEARRDVVQMRDEIARALSGKPPRPLKPPR
jgi:RNA polymerase sigma factor (sigma-70 family)